MNSQTYGKNLIEQIDYDPKRLQPGYTDDTIIHHGVLEEDINFIEKTPNKA
jgi:hypothetical protein